MMLLLLANASGSCPCNRAACSWLQSEYVVHRVPPWRAAGEVFGGLQGAARIAIARMGAVRQLQRLAERAEKNRVFAYIIAYADGVNTDLMRRPFADQPFPAVAQ